jgi:cytidyltransferase-like protein
MIALFSGRFDTVHVGHIIQILRLGQMFDRVIVPVLDYPEQHYPVQYRVQVLKDIFKPPKYEVFSNKEHFAKITHEEINKYTFDIYVSQNMECLKHIESLGYKILYVDRAYEYRASDEFR